MAQIPFGQDDHINSKKTPLMRRSHVAMPKDLSHRIKTTIIKEQRLLIAVAIAVLLFNIPYGQFLLYPFMIFGRWIHELCHAITAIMLGGSVDALFIYPDGTGVTYTSVPEDDNWYHFRIVLVAGAGYVGTSLLGCFLLIFRRTRRGPRVGLFIISIAIFMSCISFVRDFFGLVVLLPMGIFLMAGGCFLHDVVVGALYALLSMTCCLNAVLNINELFGSEEWTVGGYEFITDARLVAEYMYCPYWFFASIWLILSILCCLAGLMFGIDPSIAPEPELQPEPEPEPEPLQDVMTDGRDIEATGKAEATQDPIKAEIETKKEGVYT